jgi:hypothetical protein
MPSSSRRAEGALTLLAIAALAVVVRVPFLLYGERFFDSDQAVEGLMARHLLQGEFPIFLWGQHYKGVPEVYLAAPVFWLFGSSVVALEATTLGCFAVFVGLQFRLFERLFSTRIAWMATVLVLSGPPTLVLWTLSGNAEVVFTLLAGTVMGLALVRWRDTRSTGALALAAAAFGFGLWVHQYIVYYAIALAICVLATTPAARAWLRDLIVGPDLSPLTRLLTLGLGVVAAVYVALGMAAFVVGGFDVTVGGRFVSMHSPQRLWRIGAALVGIAALIRVSSQLAKPERGPGRSLAFAMLIGFAAGYAPAIGAALVSRGSAPVPRIDAAGLVTASSTIATTIVPMVFGFRSHTTEWLPVSPWLALILVAVMAMSIRAISTRPMTPFFHILAVVVPLVFLVSGSFVDSQSYRYLMPIYGAVPAVLAIGIDDVWRWRRGAAIAVLVSVVALFAAQQIAWYERLSPDTRSQAIVDCLTVHGLRGAVADYWVSYKVTFLSNERLILAPSNGIDRYPPYTAFVRSLGGHDADGSCPVLLLQ